MKKLPFLAWMFRQKAAVTSLGIDQGWPIGLIREPFGGAWQSHVTTDSQREITTFSAVFACITKIAGDVAKMRIKLVEDKEDGTCLEVMGASPFKIPLRTPNDYQTRVQFVQYWVATKLLYGNSYLLKARDNRGVVQKLYPLDPSRVKVLVADTGDVFYEVAIDHLATVKQNVTVPASEIIHDRMCALWHPLVGISPLYAAALTATQGNRIQKNSTAFFQNMSRPGGILSAPGKLDGEDAAKLKNEWEAAYGANGTGKTAVLGNGLTYTPLAAVVAQHAQLAEQLKWTVEDIARAFGVPLYKIGGPIPANTSVESLDQQYYSECLQIILEGMEACLDSGLEIPTGKGVEFDLDGLLRMDSAALHESLAKAVGAGYMTPNEARRKVNLPPTTGGNACYLQEQNYSLPALNKRDQLENPFAAKKEPETVPKPDAPDASNEDAYAAAQEIADLFIKGLAA